MSNVSKLEVLVFSLLVILFVVGVYSCNDLQNRSIEEYESALVGFDNLTSTGRIMATQVSIGYALGAHVWLGVVYVMAFVFGMGFLLLIIFESLLKKEIKEKGGGS